MTIRLRERGTKKIHVFKGWKEKVKAPENRYRPDTVQIQTVVEIRE